MCVVGNIAVGVAIGMSIGVAGAICISIGVSSIGSAQLRDRGWVSAEILVVVCCAIAHRWLAAALLQHLHLGLLGLVVLGAKSREEVDEEAEHVKAVDE